MGYEVLIIAVLAAVVLLQVWCRVRGNRAVKRLGDRNNLLQTLIDSFPSPVFYKDMNGRYLGCNETFEKMVGHSREWVIGKTVYDLAPPELAKVYEEADNEMYRGRSVQRYETRVQFADGEMHDFFFTKAVYRDGDGEPAGLLGVMTDITDRKRAEDDLRRAHEDLEVKVRERTAELRESNRKLEREAAERLRAEGESRRSKEFLETVINSIDHGLVVVDVENYAVLMANKAAAKAAQIGGESCYELLHGRHTPCDAKEELCPLVAIRETGNPQVTQHRHKDAEGRFRYVEIHSYPVFDEAGRVVQAIHNIMDVTTRRESELAIVEAKEMAETTNRLMSEFLDTVAHELRTPMTSVHGFSKLISKAFDKYFKPLAGDDPRLNKAAGRIEENLSIVMSESDRLGSLINDHLDLSKLQSGRMDWRDVEVVPGELIRRAVSATESLFVDRDVVLSVDVEDGLPSISGDRDRLLQVLINLISNAAKFTDHGTVACHVRRDGEGLSFSVSDSGMGIPEDQQADIFSKFRQVRLKHGGKPAGTGLGLAICKEIVGHHSGVIGVESEPGQGSVFTFTIPLERD